MKRSDSLVTNFCIGENIFHHFGTNRNKGLSAQVHNPEDPSRKRDTWSLVTEDMLDDEISLQFFLEKCVINKRREYPEGKAL